MRESRTYGFVRGVLGDWHPYRDSQSNERKIPDCLNRTTQDGHYGNYDGSRFCF